MSFSSFLMSVIPMPPDGGFFQSCPSHISLMSHFIYSFNRAFGQWATKHPETWIYSCAVAGMIISFLMYGGCGYFIGMPMHQSLICMYAGLGLYALWFINNVDELKSVADQQVQMLKQLRR